jgi:hypothetical protein
MNRLSLNRRQRRNALDVAGNSKPTQKQREVTQHDDGRANDGKAARSEARQASAASTATKT